MEYSKLSNEELEKLVNNKDGEAICELAERCMYGRNDHVVNLTRAYQLFHKGEKMGLSRAYVGLGEMYRLGKRFHQNETLAREYYQKAGVPYPESCPVPQPDTVSASESLQQNTWTQQNSPVITSKNIRAKLNSAEIARRNDDYASARSICNEIIQSIEQISLGTVVYKGNETVDEFLTETYWILAFTAYNEQNFQELDRCMGKNNVQEMHPWGVYLSVIGHRIMRYSAMALERDIQRLMLAKENRNLSREEKGDICAMIGDLISEGYGKDAGLTPDMAKRFYEEGMQCDNAYAEERYREML